MRKMSRLFEIVLHLSLARQVMTAQVLAERLEVSERTVYRDIAALQAMRVPIEGERGMGYVLRAGHMMPPLMLTEEEGEAVTVALGLLARRGDPGLAKAAEGVLGKLAGVAPERLRRRLTEPALHVWGGPQGSDADLALLRRAIRDEEKVEIRYRDAEGRETERIILPVALVYYEATENLVAHCELRGGIRHFRPERIAAVRATGMSFAGRGEILRRTWRQGWQEAG